MDEVFTRLSSLTTACARKRASAERPSTHGACMEETQPDWTSAKGRFLRSGCRLVPLPALWWCWSGTGGHQSEPDRKHAPWPSAGVIWGRCRKIRFLPEIHRAACLRRDSGQSGRRFTTGFTEDADWLCLQNAFTTDSH